MNGTATREVLPGLVVPKDVLEGEARARIDRALRHIENAQGELSHACAELSAIVGAIPHWRTTGRLYDRVKTCWYKLDGFRWSGRYRLDDTNVEALTQRWREGLLRKASGGSSAVR